MEKSRFTVSEMLLRKARGLKKGQKRYCFDNGCDTVIIVKRTIFNDLVFESEEGTLCFKKETLQKVFDGKDNDNI